MSPRSPNELSFSSTGELISRRRAGTAKEHATLLDKYLKYQIKTPDKQSGKETPNMITDFNLLDSDSKRDTDVDK